MTTCPGLAGDGGASIAGALRGVDCMTGQATAFAFGRLFGADGRLLPALTLLLTLYVGFFAVGLLTGRTRIGLGALTPRMLTLGLVLTFATSWAAYQNVVWTLATGAPDQIASVLAGTHGSATTAFADRLDRLFEAVQQVADAASRPAPATQTGVTPATPMVGGFTAATVLWLSALMLLLGTVGVLVVTKIALAAMLVLGPIFMVLALFPATRGLFEGWLKAVVLFAVIPLLAVLVGGGAVMALDPVVRALAMEGSEPSSRAVAVLFLGAAVFLALMAISAKAAATLVMGWRLPGSRSDGDRAVAAASATTMAAMDARAVQGSGGMPIGPSGSRSGDDRIREVVAALPPPAADGMGSSRARLPAMQARSAEIVSITGGAFAASRGGGRAVGVGSRFRPQQARISRDHIA